LLTHSVEVRGKNVWLDRSMADPKFYDGPTRYKHAAALQTCLDQVAKGTRFAHIKIALVDLTKSKLGKPDFAAFGGTEQVFVASVAKIAAMLAAFQLRQDLRELLALTKSATLAALFDEQRDRWVLEQTSDPGERPNPFTRRLSLLRRMVLLRGTKVPLTSARMPRLDRVFADVPTGSPMKIEFRRTGETKSQLSDIIKEFNERAVELESGKKRKLGPSQMAKLKRAMDDAQGKAEALGFLERLRLMMGGIVPASNFATSTIVRDVGYGFMASTLLQTGIYDTDRNGGLWLGASYWTTATPAWRAPLAGGSHQSATAASLASLMTLLAQQRLVSPQASRDMVALMQKVGNLTHPGTPSSFMEGLKRLSDNGSLLSMASKVGDLGGNDDCALIERRVPAGSGDTQTLRYVAVGLRAKDDSELEQLILSLDKCILANNNLSPTQGGHSPP
jgi:hypothetical protein